MKTLLRISCLMVMAASALQMPAFAAWPPSDSTRPFGNVCKEILFFQAVSAVLESREREERIAELEAAGDHAEAASLRLHNAATRRLIELTDILFEGQIARFMQTTDDGMSPFQAFFMLGDSPFVPGWHLGQNLKGEPYFNKQLYPNLKSAFDMTLFTPFYFSQKGIISELSRIVVPALAGIGAEHSHSGSVFALLNLLLSETAKKSGIVSQIRSDPNYLRVNPFAFDLPNNGGAFRSPSFTDLKKNMYWLAAGINHFRPHWNPDLGSPLVVPILRSASPSLLMQMHQMLPNMLNGLIATSPLHPFDLEIGNRTLKKLVAEGVYKANDAANAWSDRLYEQMDWHLKEDPFVNDLPVLILVGTKDPEETEALAPKRGWDIYREWERKFPHKVRFIIIEGAGHDLFAIRDKEILERVMKYVYRFFRFILNGEKDMAAAFPIEPGEIRGSWKEIFWKNKGN